MPSLISTDTAAMKAASKSLDLIMNTVSATHDYNAYQRLLRVDGAQVLLGVPPTDMPPPAVGRMIGNRLTARGLDHRRHRRDAGNARLLRRPQHRL